MENNGMSALYALIVTAIVNTIKGWYNIPETAHENSMIQRIKALRTAFADVHKLLGDSDDGKIVHQLYGLKESKGITEAWSAIPEVLRPLIADNAEMLKVWTVDLCERIVPEALRQVEYNKVVRCVDCHVGLTPSEIHKVCGRSGPLCYDCAERVRNGINREQLQCESCMERDCLQRHAAYVEQ